MAPELREGTRWESWHKAQPPQAARPPGQRTHHVILPLPRNTVGPRPLGRWQPAQSCPAGQGLRWLQAGLDADPACAAGPVWRAQSVQGPDSARPAGTAAGTAAAAGRPPLPPWPSTAAWRAEWRGWAGGQGWAGGLRRAPAAGQGRGVGSSWRRRCSCQGDKVAWNKGLGEERRLLQRRRQRPAVNTAGCHKLAVGV